MHVTCPANYNVFHFDYCNSIRRRVQIRDLHFLQPPGISSRLAPNNLLRNLFQTPEYVLFINLKAHVPRLYEITNYIFFMFLDRRSEVKYSEMKVSKHCAKIKWFNFFREWNFGLLMQFRNILIFSQTLKIVHSDDVTWTYTWRHTFPCIFSLFISVAITFPAFNWIPAS